MSANSNNKKFQPYIPADKVLPELTGTSLIIGVLLAVVWRCQCLSWLEGGMTISASIPAAVISHGHN